MTPRSDWKERLLPYAKSYQRHVTAIESKIKALSDRDLVLLEEATEEPRSGNCWWATYWVAREVRDAVGLELYRRRKAKTAQGVG